MKPYIVGFLFGVVCFIAGFFVGGKWKEILLRKVGIIKLTAEQVAATIKEAGKKL